MNPKPNVFCIIEPPLQAGYRRFFLSVDFFKQTIKTAIEQLLLADNTPNQAKIM